MPRATIDDVAARAGVSKGTVSLVYSGKRTISEETRERVLRAAADLDWVPSSRARALATRRSSTIGLVLARDPDVIATDTFFAGFLAGVEAVLSTVDMGVLMQVVPDHDRERDAYRSLARGRVDGVLLLDLEIDDARLDIVRSLSLPAVIVGAHPNPAGLPQAHVDDGRGMVALLDHLIELGHSRIAHVSGPVGYVHARHRLDTFRSSLRERGLDPSLVVEGDFTAQSGRSATAELLAAETPPTAITFANDVMAMAGLSYAQSIGVAVPDDLSVTGFDDSELAAHLTPSLTTVHTDVVAWGRRAAESLLGHIAGDDVADAVLDGPHLVNRNSTGPAAS
ncbi:LacI family DNA-binding transcriptional regulator [Georgenia halophila]|uniref:LacI family DNA-binding transcriptional regulator n=1 Tax=Georgenia halophila TaxID=620889 RepID=A0ABP8LKI2_9MICO